MAIDTQKLRERIDAAIKRIKSGSAPMRIPADQTDPDLVLADAKIALDAQAAEIAEAKGQIEHLDRRNNALRQSLGSMIHAYVRLLECGRDRILDLGGQCDPLDVLEVNDPWLRDARAAIAKAEGKS